jgi:hypothetical protein
MTIETNERGGKQSKIEGRCTEIPPLAMIELSKVMGLGSVNYPREPDGTPNWYLIDCWSNLDHCLEHAFNALAERNKPDSDMKYIREELSHCMARVCMAMEQCLRNDL